MSENVWYLTLFNTMRVKVPTDSIYQQQSCLNCSVRFIHTNCNIKQYNSVCWV